MATTTFYYPEGPLGPICDIVVPDEVAVDLGIDDGDGRVPTYGPIDLEDLDRITDGTARYIKTRRCKQRTLSDGYLLYPSDAAEDLPCVDIGGRRHNQKKHTVTRTISRNK